MFPFKETPLQRGSHEGQHGDSAVLQLRLGYPTIGGIPRKAYFMAIDYKIYWKYDWKYDWNGIIDSI